MPVADPAQWRLLRIEWESSAEMTLREVAKRLNVSTPAVTQKAKRELWVKSEVVEPTRLSYSPKDLVELSIRALVRAATQTKDHASAIKAAGMLLDRTMGRVVAEQQTPMLPAEVPDTEKWPEWLSHRRLAYQEGQPESETPPEGTTQPAPRAQETRTAPVQSPQQENAGNAPQNRKTNGAVLFFDRPGLPATGPTRDPNRFN